MCQLHPPGEGAGPETSNTSGGGGGAATQLDNARLNSRIREILNKLLTHYLDYERSALPSRAPRGSPSQGRAALPRCDGDRGQFCERMRRLL